MERAQSKRSPMWARILMGTRAVSPLRNVEKDSGALIRGFLARYAAVATVWRRNWRTKSGVGGMLGSLAELKGVLPQSARRKKRQDETEMTTV
jgi:hypothetical protein